MKNSPGPFCSTFIASIKYEDASPTNVQSSRKTLESDLQRSRCCVMVLSMKGKVSSAAGIHWPIFPKGPDRQVCLITCWGRGGQLRRSDMFIVHESKGNHLEPHRGGMMASDAGHAAPTELERILGCAVTFHKPASRRNGLWSQCAPEGLETINMSLLRGWVWLGRRSNSNPVKGPVPESRTICDETRNRPAPTQVWHPSRMRAAWTRVSGGRFACGPETTTGYRLPTLPGWSGHSKGMRKPNGRPGPGR